MSFVVKNTSDYRKIFDSLLERIESKDQTGLSANLKILRDRILYAHAKAEAKVEMLIQDEFRHYCLWTDDIYVEQRVYYATGDLLSCMDFRDKLRACEKLKILTKKQLRLISKLNELRNNFAHRKAEDLKIYENDENFAEAIKVIIDSLVIIRVLVIPDKRIK